jgi:hypothetical protein
MRTQISDRYSMKFTLPNVQSQYQILLASVHIISTNIISGKERKLYFYVCSGLTIIHVILIT